MNFLNLFNILCIIGIINSLSYLFRGSKKPIGVFCGLVGYYSEKPMNPSTFKLLMIYNKERGTDSTGICANNKIFKDTIPADKFFPKFNFNFNNSNCKIVLGHVRKQSQGGYKLEKAHPVGVYDENQLLGDLFSDPDKDVNYGNYYQLLPELVLVMNGTVSNCRDLCDDFEVRFNHMHSDTESIALILRKLGKDNYKKLLEKYLGASTMMWYWTDEPNKLYISKDPDRPLYLLAENDECWISSMDEPLKAIAQDKENVKFFEDEFAYIFTDGKISQKLPFVKRKASTTTTGQSTTHSRSSSNPSYSGSSAATATQTQTSATVKEKASKISNKYIQWDPAQGRYYKDDQPMNGEFVLDDEGQEVALNQGGEVYYFFCGYLLNNAKVYDELMAEFGKKGTKVDGKRFFKAESGYTATRVSHMTQTPIRSWVGKSTIWWNVGSMSSIKYTWPFIGVEVEYSDGEKVGQKLPKEVLPAKILRDPVMKTTDAIVQVIKHCFDSNSFIDYEFMQAAVVEALGLEAGTSKDDVLNKILTFFEKRNLASKEFCNYLYQLAGANDYVITNAIEFKVINEFVRTVSSKEFELLDTSHDVVYKEIFISSPSELMKPFLEPLSNELEKERMIDSLAVHLHECSIVSASLLIEYFSCVDYKNKLELLDKIHDKWKKQ